MLYALTISYLDRGVIKCCRVTNGVDAKKGCNRERAIHAGGQRLARTEAAFAASGCAPRNMRVASCREGVRLSSLTLYASLNDAETYTLDSTIRYRVV